MRNIIIVISLFLIIGSKTMNGQANPKPADTSHAKPNEWYKKIALRGYTQIRYNRLLETNPNLKNDPLDKSWGSNTGLLIRRARLIFSGNVHERVYIYVQVDLANQVSSTINTTHFVQIRDCYFDLALDNKKEFRIRFGQSKVPYGFENIQSSQNRVTIDRSDAINSAAPNERDLGLFAYWAPAKVRERFAYLVSSGLKGSGDYGVIGFGIYNGQSSNKVETNNNQHMLGHITYPFLINKKQIIEIGAHAYKGIYTVSKNAKTKGATEVKDERVCGSVTVYPQPFGFQAEYNIGRGPEFQSSDSSIKLKNLKGGYVQFMYMKTIKKQVFTPFVRYQIYDGGRKSETDARSYSIKDLEVGIEWQPIPNFELTANYTVSDRRYQDYDKPYNFQKGNLLRLQAQFNF